MASRPWSPEDVTVLEQHVADDDWLETLAEFFPDRTVNAIKVRMSKVRADLGIQGKRGARAEDQDRSNAKAVVASQRLLEATLRIGVWA